ncbi:hypothetical protein [Acinetobacter wuhouensis]|uniref:Uncharacterized protein n=1 Tax=Acinetobacter wuhouensis TaxID=1879050 RepID=A0A4Q7ANU5_9GAMM|nr:hypothetical protein [Acinetobacter wuhouensis]RZG46601.1 hypothetical protein EXU28_08435 [Acinetobacter wuhouensis]RZG72357.1 hypothetical protein EXU29_10565 [Acinetobacter wuhouensis]
MNQNQDVQSQILNHLKTFDGLLVPVLVQLIQQRYPLEVKTLAFEIFSEQFTEQFPIRVFFLDENHSEHFVLVNGEARYPSVIDPNLILIDGVYPQSFETEYLAQGIDIWSVASQVCMQWFIEHWNNVGGANFALHATIAQHDSSEQFDLIEQTRM